jgi:hypothetical protein
MGPQGPDGNLGPGKSLAIERWCRPMRLRPTPGLIKDPTGGALAAP